MNLLQEKATTIFGFLVSALTIDEKKKTLKRKLEDLTSREADVLREIEDAELLWGKKRRVEVENWLRNVGMIKNDVESLLRESRWSSVMTEKVEKFTAEVNELVETGRFEQGLVHDAYEKVGEALITTKLVGKAFGINMGKIWECLMKDEVLIVGIYGMGGVGKTSLVTHIYNRLREVPSIFHYVCWITVSQDFSIYKLQTLIAKTIHLDLSNEDDERKRAAKLSKAFIRRRKSILILDDLWDHFPLEKVGIPVRVNGCRLILTSRSLKVCKRMGCQKDIKVDPLSQEEAWNLFVEKLGHDGSLPPEVEHIAKYVVRECAGLPLGIITMAGTMRGVTDVREWRNTLKELRESKVRSDDMEAEVFKVLKLSYDRLNDSTLQQCLLYCALFPEDYHIVSEHLINYLIAEGIIKGEKSRRAELDYGYTMLNKLEDACLIQLSTREGHKENCRYIKMHDLVRDMALQIMKKSPRALVEAGAQLTEMPDEENWAEDLKRVSLMHNFISKVPSSYSPKCPHLSTLLLCNNPITLIADSFFNQLQGLVILDISTTNIQKLPVSVCELVQLTALMLGQCYKLRHVPSLAKLQALKTLDLSHTGLKEVPQGVELLSDLRYLDLDGAEIQKFPTGILPNLSRLQFLRLGGRSKASMMVKGEEVGCLRKLESLQCIFHDVNDFNKYLKVCGQPKAYLTIDRLSIKQVLSTFNIFVGPAHFYTICLLRDTVLECNPKAVWLSNCNISGGGDLLALPEGIQKLVIARCNDMRSLCDVPLLKHATQLVDLSILECAQIQCLARVSSVILENLEHLKLRYLDNLSILITKKRAAPLLSNATFSRLKSFSMHGCHRMKKLFSPGLLRYLQGLEHIGIADCQNMEEIIGIEEEEEEEEEVVGATMVEESNNSKQFIEFSLPKLRDLKLSLLPELRSICSGVVVCDSIQEIEVLCCEKLKRMPLSLPLLDNGQPRPPPPLKRVKIRPRELWDSVDWDHPNAKDVLLPYCDID